MLSRATSRFYTLFTRGDNYDKMRFRNELKGARKRWLIITINGKYFDYANKGVEMVKQTITRRLFLKKAAGAVAIPLFLPSLSRAGEVSKKLAHGSIGVGGMGWNDLNSIYNSGKVEIAVLCDVDANNLKKAAEKFPQARQYRDWREMLEKEGDKIDSINVTVPDHMHAPIAMTGLHKGKHVYCQKPLTHEVYEARQLRSAAQQAGVVTQMGIQIHAHIAYRMAAQMLGEGAIGKVKEWHSWVGAEGWPGVLERPAGADPVPDYLNWDNWVGVAPFRPYKEKIYHPFRWRGWKDFGCGALGDFLCHIFDPIFMGLGIKEVLSVQAEKQKVYAETWPQSSILHYEFRGTKLTAGKTIKATWYDGGKMPGREVAPMPADRNLPKNGSAIIGEEGVMVLPHWAGPQLYPLEKFKGYPRPKLEVVDHYHQWVGACLGEGKASANFDYAVPLTEAALLGTIAIRLSGKKLEWDAKKMQFVNTPKANQYLRRKYRRGWEVERL